MSLPPALATRPMMADSDTVGMLALHLKRPLGPSSRRIERFYIEKKIY